MLDNLSSPNSISVKALRADQSFFNQEEIPPMDINFNSSQRVPACPS